MRLELPGGGHVTIDKQRAEKILKGYEFEIDTRGKVIVGKKRTRFDLFTFKKKLKQKKATLDDIQSYLFSTLK